VTAYLFKPLVQAKATAPLRFSSLSLLSSWHVNTMMTKMILKHAGNNVLNDLHMHVVG